jgi:hypothetical protein
MCFLVDEKIIPFPLFNKSEAADAIIAGPERPWRIENSQWRH